MKSQNRETVSAPSFDTKIDLNLSIEEIAETFLPGCDSYYTSWEPATVEASLALETATAINGSNSCKLHYTEAADGDELHNDLVIELKIGAIYLVAHYYVVVQPGWRAEYRFQRESAESDFTMASALIGCRMQQKLSQIAPLPCLA